MKCKICESIFEDDLQEMQKKVRDARREYQAKKDEVEDLLKAADKLKDALEDCRQEWEDAHAMFELFRNGQKMTKVAQVILKSGNGSGAALDASASR